MVKVLFIDDDPHAQKTLHFVLPDFYTLVSAYTATEGIEHVTRDPPDVILLDVNLPDMDGIAALRRIVALPVSPPVVMLTGLTEPRVVKEAILAGACDYVVKPYELKELLGTLRTAVAGSDARRAAQCAEPQGVMDGLIGESAGMREAKELILRYAPSDSPALITGESGTGKEMAARLIHAVSRRKDEPFVAVNCGALPETLLETELFGAEKGAFTDAVPHAGSFERASGGTLFLDEIGEMPGSAQTRLLRIIEEKELTRVGGTRAIPIDVRVVSATNRDLKAETAGGGFRTDLFYRLAVLPIHLPPLREHPADIPLLAAHFMAQRKGQRHELSPGAQQALQRHPWPGNIRELRNVLERAALAASGGVIQVRDLSFD